MPEYISNFKLCYTRIYPTKNPLIAATFTMPPKRRTATRTPSQQSTLAFHASSNKVTKSGTRAQQAKKNLDKPTEKPTKPETVDISVSDEEPPVVEKVEMPVVEVEQPVSTPEEEEARTVTEKQIKAYWETRKGKNLRVHQSGLTVHDKILRDFDMSNHYGVSRAHGHCIHF